MLASIHPLGERAKGNRWGVTVTALVVGNVVGGAVAGGVAGFAGWLVTLAVEVSSETNVWLAALVLFLALLGDLGFVRYPGPRRQVDEAWLTRYRGWVYGGGYGFQLGIGVVTIVSSAAVYAYLFIVGLLANPAWGAAVGGLFGLVRGLAIVPGARITSAARLRRFHQGMDEQRRRARRFTPLGEGVVLVVVVAALILDGSL